MKPSPCVLRGSDSHSPVYSKVLFYSKACSTFNIPLFCRYGIDGISILDLGFPSDENTKKSFPSTVDRLSGDSIYQPREKPG